MTRLPDIVESELSPEQKKVYDAIAGGPRGGVRGPLRVWLNSAELADKAQRLGAFCRYDTSLPPRLSELAILIMGAFWKAAYEWNAHAPQALKAGVSPAVIEAIRTGDTPHFERADEVALYAFATELLNQRRVSEATFKTAHEALGTKALVELVGIMGYYTLISMTILAFEVPPAGDDPFAARSKAPQ